MPDDLSSDAAFAPRWNYGDRSQFERAVSMRLDLTATDHLAIKRDSQDEASPVQASGIDLHRMD